MRTSNCAFRTLHCLDRSVVGGPRLGNGGVRSHLRFVLMPDVLEVAAIYLVIIATRRTRGVMIVLGIRIGEGQSNP